MFIQIKWLNKRDANGKKSNIIEIIKWIIFDRFDKLQSLIIIKFDSYQIYQLHNYGIISKKNKNKKIFIIFN